jgi:hypothetical protein
MITTPNEKIFLSSKPSHYFAVFVKLDRFEVDVMEKPFFMLLSEISIFICNHLRLKVPKEVGVSVIPVCVNDVPKYPES